MRFHSACHTKAAAGMAALCFVAATGYAWILLACSLGQARANRQEPQVRLLVQRQDPYGFPRPGRDQHDVPLRTSFYFELGTAREAASDTVLPESVAVRLEAGGERVEVLGPGRRFAPGYSGKLFPRTSRRGASLAVYIESGEPLEPATRYAVRVAARSSGGGVLGAEEGRWSFTTEAAAAVTPVSLQADLAGPAARWQGGFFSGFCKPSFCTSATNRVGTYALMREARKEFPRAWTLQRDFWMTGMEHQPSFLSGNLPNVVRELETRRIVRMERRDKGVVLHLEDFVGHEQYEIPAGRPLSGDYHEGEEVLVADGVHDARATVLAVDDEAGTVTVSALEEPLGGWQLAYKGPVGGGSAAVPGRFAPGGCYLRKFRPGGTPQYYWGRLDAEWDLVRRLYGPRLMPNFADAPGDLSVDGRNWTTAKDYAELHEAVRAMTGHLIERYGEACLDFPWSVFNEPDLGAAFWRADWEELQSFYDYTVDGVLRAFEEHGLDSERVMIGGLELGAIFGTNLRLREFLVHCSPRAEGKGALRLNAAFADERLEGKRSQRVERLCSANDGKGTPCDFVSIHAYNRSEVMAAKLAAAKRMALEIDPDYYGELWINSHESCPGWAPPPDPAAADSYLGNGYFPSWCADVVRRQLAQAAEDARFAFGETILTFWPWPNANFGGANDVCREIQVDDDGDGRRDRAVTVPMPIFHFLNLLSSMGERYWVLPERRVAGHVVSGFASREGGTTRVVVYAHHDLDTQSRSDAAFEVRLTLRGLNAGDVHVGEYRFDKQNNTYFALGRKLRERGSEPADDDAAGPVQAEVTRLQGGEKQEQLAALQELGGMGRRARGALGAIVELVQNSGDEELRAAATAAVMRINAPVVYTTEEVEQVQRLAELRATRSASEQVEEGGTLTYTVVVGGNGINFVVIEPVQE